MFGEISSALTVFEKIRGYLKNATQKEVYYPEKSIETIVDRFIRLFEIHDIHRNQIPRFFGHNLTLEDVSEHSKLLAKLNDKTIDDVCELFLIRREWLEGADEQIYTTHDFYKSVDACKDFVEKLKEKSKHQYVYGRLFWEDQNTFKGIAVLVITELAGKLGDREIYRHYICNNFVPGYFKSRAYLTACISIFNEFGVYIRGAKVQPGSLEKLHEGMEFISNKSFAKMRMNGKPWYPEDLVVNPDAYINGVEPYENGSGIESALRYWITMVESGEVSTNESRLTLPKFKEKLALL